MAETTATGPIAPEYLTEAVCGLLESVRAGRRELLPVLADALEDAGCADGELLAAVRAGTVQVTEEGARVVTVARDGAKCATVGRRTYPILCTTVYRAVRRADGVLTWRRECSLADGTAGYAVTGPMIERAKMEAARRGCRYDGAIRHGRRCD
jgi:hypothetical protein